MSQCQETREHCCLQKTSQCQRTLKEGDDDRERSHSVEDSGGVGESQMMQEVRECY